MGKSEGYRMEKEVKQKEKMRETCGKHQWIGVDGMMFCDGTTMDV